MATLYVDVRSFWFCSHNIQHVCLVLLWSLERNLFWRTQLSRYLFRRWFAWKCYVIVSATAQLSLWWRIRRNLWACGIIRGACKKNGSYACGFPLRDHDVGHECNRVWYGGERFCPRVWLRWRTCDGVAPFAGVSFTFARLFGNLHLRLILRLLAYFSMGILMPFSLATFIDDSYPASACRTTPMPGSVVSTRIARFSISGVPSSTRHMPAWML